MGTLGSRLLGRKQIKFFQGKDYLTAVSEGEEVVWTNFENVPHEKSFRYDVPPVNHLLDGNNNISTASSSSLASTAGNGGSSTAATTTKNSLISGSTVRRKSALDDMIGSASSSTAKDSRRPSGNNAGVIRRPSGNTNAVIRRPSANSVTSGSEPVSRRPSARSDISSASAMPSKVETVKERTTSSSKPDAKPTVTIDAPSEENGSTLVTGPDGFKRRKSVAMMKRESTVGKELVSVEPSLASLDSKTDLSIISLNLLADFNLTNSVANPSDGRYKHAVEAATWESRLPKLWRLFESHSTVDVFALQEVDFFRYRDDLKPMLDQLGYVGAHQWDEDFAKKGAPNHPFGLATFYKKDKFRESFKEARSRTFILGLSYAHRPTAPVEADAPSKAKGGKKNKKSKAGGADWFVVNVHLEADPKKDSKRLAQLSSALFNLSVHTKINPLTARIVVLGDFNSLREDAPFQWLIARSYNEEASKRAHAGENDAPKGTYDTEELASKRGDQQTNLTLTDKENKTGNDAGVEQGENEEEGENGKLAHAFKFADAYGSTSIDDKVRNASTYADPFADGRVDHLLFTSDTCTVLSVLSIPELTGETKQFGIFGSQYPSDHFPVGCLVRAMDPEFPAEQPEEEETDPNVCPLTEGQMRVLEFLEQGAPKRTGKGKPTPQELAAIKTHTERVNAFSSHLSKSQKAWVAKWRKKYKPEKEKDDEDEAPKKITRSRSVFARVSSPFRTISGELIGIGDLLDGKLTMTTASKDKPPKMINKSVSEAQVDVPASNTHVEKTPGLPPTPPLLQRRQTVHGKKTAFLDL